MKLEVQINAVLKEDDPVYKTITKLGLDKAIEKIKKDLSGVGVESIEVSVKELK